MAVTDLVNSAVSSPLFVVREIIYQLRQEPNCYVSISLFSVSKLAIASAIIMTAINVERYLGLKYPLWHHIHVTKSRLAVVAVISWILACSLTTLQIFMGKGFAFAVFVLLVVCTIAALVFAMMISRVISKRNQVHPLNLPQSEHASISDSKSAKMAMFMALGFLFTRIIPVIIIIAIASKQEWVKVAAPLRKATILMNPLLNPLIYGLLNRGIRNACLELIK